MLERGTVQARLPKALECLERYYASTGQAKLGISLTVAPAQLSAAAHLAARKKRLKRKELQRPWLEAHCKRKCQELSHDSDLQQSVEAYEVARDQRLKRKAEMQRPWLEARSSKRPCEEPSPDPADMTSAEKLGTWLSTMQLPFQDLTQNSVPSDSESSLGRGESDTPSEEIEDYEDCPDDDAIISLLRLVRAEFLARESTGYPEPLSTSPFTPGPVTWGGVMGGVFL